MMAHHYINLLLTSASYIAGKQVRPSAVSRGCQCVKLMCRCCSATAQPSSPRTQSSSPSSTGAAQRACAVIFCNTLPRTCTVAFCNTLPQVPPRPMRHRLPHPRLPSCIRSQRCSCVQLHSLLHALDSPHGAHDCARASRHAGAAGHSRVDVGHVRAAGVLGRRYAAEGGP